MYIPFSTSCEHLARTRMIVALGDYAGYATDLISYVCELTKQGHVRVGDPMMYKNAEIFPTKTCTDEMREKLKKLYAEMIKKIPAQSTSAGKPKDPANE